MNCMRAFSFALLCVLSLATLPSCSRIEHSAYAQTTQVCSYTSFPIQVGDATQFAVDVAGNGQPGSMFDIAIPSGFPISSGALLKLRGPFQGQQGAPLARVGDSDGLLLTTGTSKMINRNNPPPCIYGFSSTLSPTVLTAHLTGGYVDVYQCQ